MHLKKRVKAERGRLPSVQVVCAPLNTNWKCLLQVKTTAGDKHTLSDSQILWLFKDTTFQLCA